MNIPTDQAIVNAFKEAVTTMDEAKADLAWRKEQDTMQKRAADFIDTLKATPALKGVDMRLFKEWLAKIGVAVRCQDGSLVFQDANPKNDSTTFTLYATCPGTEEEHDSEGAWVCVLVGSAK